MKQQETKIKIIKKLYEKAKSVKKTWEDLYDEVYRYTIPFRGRAYENSKTNGEYEKVDSRLFNSVGQQAAVNFVNRIQQILTPIDNDFIGMEAGDFHKTQNASNIIEINKQLDNISNILNTTKAVSNFDSAISEFYFDLVAGTACILVQPGTPDEPVIFKTIPFKDYCILEGANGRVDSIFREFCLKVEEIKSICKGANESVVNKIQENKKQKDTINLIESCMYNYEKSIWEYVIHYKEDVLVFREYKVNPFIILRWNKGSNDYYGQGVGMLAINDLYTYNKMMSDFMVALRYSLPTFITDDDDIFSDDIELDPSTINKVKFDSNGRPRLQQLQVNTNLNIADNKLESYKLDINKSMLANTLPTDSSKMTAYEIQQRIAEQQVDFTSVFGRLIKEFLYELPKVMLQILQDHFNMFKDFKINEINGFHIKIRIKTPLARINKENEINNTMQGLQTLLQIDPSGSFIKRFIKLDETIIDLLQNIGFPKDKIYNIEEIKSKEYQDLQIQQFLQTQNVQNQVDAQGAIDFNKELAKKINQK